MKELLLSALSLPLVILLSNTPYILCITLTLLLIILHKISPQPVLFYIVCGIGGVAAESLTIKYGKKTWIYTEPFTPLNVPIWLFPLWAIAAIFIISVSTYLKH